MSHTVTIPDGVDTVYIIAYPEGHPNGPWQVDFITQADRRWRRGRGATPQEAIDNTNWVGDRVPDPTYSIERKPLPSSLANIELDL